MALVYVEDLSPGMILNSDLRSPSGRFILAAGSALQDSALNALSAWGVFEADIVETSLDQAYLDKQRALAPFKERAYLNLTARIVAGHNNHEPIATLLRHLSHRNALLLQTGAPVMAVPEIKGLKPTDDLSPPLTLPQLLRGASGIFYNPLVFGQIIELCKDDTLSVSKLAALLDKDPGLTVKLLRLVNSPHYGLTNKVDSVARAISLLGTDELKKLSLGRWLIKDFTSLPEEILDQGLFWRHGIRCGLFARAIAESVGVDRPQQYFSGGLLHDIGRLTMLERMPQQFLAAIAHAREDGVPLFRAEQEILKLDHALVGQFLGERWGLDPVLVKMIGGHHSPRLANYSLPACILHVADIFSHLSGHEMFWVETVPELQGKAWQTLSLDVNSLAPLLARVEKEFTKTMELFFTDEEEGANVAASR